MFNLVPQANQEFQILPLRWIRIGEVLFEALGQFPMLGVSVYFQVPNTFACGRALLAIPRAPIIVMKESMKKSSPCDRYEYDVLRRAETGSWPVVCIDRCDGTVATLL